MTTDAIYKERGSHWSQLVSAVVTTQWLQHDQTLPLSAKGVACETRRLSVTNYRSENNLLMFRALVMTGAFSRNVGKLFSEL